MATALTTAIRGALKYQFLQITTANGYNTTVYEVQDFPYNEQKLNNFPGGVMIGADDNILNTINGMNPQGGLVKNYDIMTDFFLDEHNNIPEAQDDLAADIESRLMAESVRSLLPDSNGNKTCTQIMFYDAHKRFIAGDGYQSKPKWTCGLRVHVRAYYVQDITNPYQLR